MTTDQAPEMTPIHWKFKLYINEEHVPHGGVFEHIRCPHLAEDATEIDCALDQGVRVIWLCEECVFSDWADERYPSSYTARLGTLYEHAAAADYHLEELDAVKAAAKEEAQARAASDGA